MLIQGSFKSAFYATSKFVLTYIFVNPATYNCPWKQVYEKYFAKAFVRYLIKISEKLSTQCYYVILENFIKIFLKVIAVRHNKWKVFHKQAFHLTSTVYLLLRWSKEKQTIHPISLIFFSNFLSFDFHVFIFFVFCISSSNSNKLNSISCGICLSFKSRHLVVFCKIIIQLFPTGIFVGLWLRGPPCNFTEELLFLHSCKWQLPII